MDAPNRQRASPRNEEDVSLQARLVGVFPGARPGGAHPAPLVDRDRRPPGTPQHGRRQPGLRRVVSLLLSPSGNLLRVRGHLFQPLPRRDAGKDAALLLPDPAAPRTAGGRQVSGGPGHGVVPVRRQHGALFPAARPPFRRGVHGLHPARSRPESTRLLHAGGGADSGRDRAGCRSQLGSYMLVAALACIGYGAVFLMCGILFRNPMIPAAVVMVWENLNPFLPTVLKKISVIFYLKNLCPVEIPIPPPFNVM